MNGGTVTIALFAARVVCRAASQLVFVSGHAAVPSTQTAQDTDAKQIRTLSESPTACREALDIVAADGQDRNSGFFRAVKGRAVGW